MASALPSPHGPEVVPPREATASSTTGQPAPRGPPARTDRRAVHDDHLRRDGRSHRAQARAGSLQLLPGGFLPPEFTAWASRAANGPTTSSAITCWRDQQVQSQPPGQARDLGVVRARRSSTSAATSTTRRRMPSSRSASIASTATAAPRGTASSTWRFHRASTRRSSSHLEQAGLAASGGDRAAGAKRGWTRVIVEKPFGYDLEAPAKLNRQLADVFDEDQVYRIDHYLARRPSRTSPSSASGTGSSSRSGTGATSTRSRSRWRRRSASRGAASSTTRPGPCATSCRTTASSSWRCSRWSRRSSSTRGPARREAEGPRAVKPMAPADVATNVVRGQYVSGWVEGERSPPYRDAPEVAPDSEDRDLRRAQARDRLLALGRRAVLPAAPGRRSQAA